MRECEVQKLMPACGGRCRSKCRLGPGRTIHALRESLTDFFPLRLQFATANPLTQFLPVDLVAGDREHRTDVPQMFVRPAFAEKLQLADDDVFGRRKHEFLAFKLNLALVAESPRVEFIAP